MFWFKKKEKEATAIEVMAVRKETRDEVLDDISFLCRNLSVHNNKDDYTLSEYHRGYNQALLDILNHCSYIINKNLFVEKDHD
jgi:hypothetical protein